MAKKSMIAREKRRVSLSKNIVKRLELSAIIEALILLMMKRLLGYKA